MQNKVAIVSTFKTQCGIARYTEDLTKYIDCDIYAEIPSGNTSIIGKDPKNVYRTWSRLDNDLNKLRDNLINEQYDIVHIMHEYSFFKDDIITKLIKDIKNAGSKVIVTSHTLPYYKTTAPSRADCFKAADIVICHNEAIQNEFKRWGIVTEVIEHGINWVFGAYKKDAKKYLKIRYPKIVLVFGIINENKRIREIVAAISQIIIKDKMKDLHCMIVGSTPARTPENWNVKYLERVRFDIDELGMRDHFHIINEFVPEDDVKYYYAAADIAIYNYGFTGASVSGSVLNSIRFGTPSIVTDSMIFNDMSNGFIKIPEGDNQALVRAIKEILKDPAPVDYKYSNREWKTKANDYIKLYKRLVV